MPRFRVDHVSNSALARGTEQVGLFAERKDPLLRSLDTFRTAPIPLRLHAKALRPGVLAADEAPLFVDVLDL